MVQEAGQAMERARERARERVRVLPALLAGPLPALLSGPLPDPLPGPLQPHWPTAHDENGLKSRKKFEITGTEQLKMIDDHKKVLICHVTSNVT